MEAFHIKVVPKWSKLWQILGIIFANILIFYVKHNSHIFGDITAHESLEVKFLRRILTWLRKPLFDLVHSLFVLFSINSEPLRRLTNLLRYLCIFSNSQILAKFQFLYPNMFDNKEIRYICNFWKRRLPGGPKVEQN